MEYGFEINDFKKYEYPELDDAYKISLTNSGKNRKFGYSIFMDLVGFYLFQKYILIYSTNVQHTQNKEFQILTKHNLQKETAHIIFLCY